MVEKFTAPLTQGCGMYVVTVPFEATEAGQAALAARFDIVLGATPAG